MTKAEKILKWANVGMTCAGRADCKNCPYYHYNSGDCASYLKVDLLTVAYDSLTYRQELSSIRREGDY